MMPYTVHEFFSGFLQRPGVTNGIARLAIELERELDSHHHAVAYHPYQTDTLDRARYIAFQETVRDRSVQVNVIGYSYGCDTAVAFCWALQAVGLAATNVVLCDPVRRYRYTYTMTPRWLRRHVLDHLPGWLPIGRPRLVLPEGVGQVYVCEQDHTPPWPSVVYHGEQRVEPIRLNVPHTHMDNHPEFRLRVLQLAGAIDAIP